MALNTIVAQIDAEIARLEQARQLLAQVDVVADGAKVRKNPPPTKLKKKRNLSPEGRARIAAAVKKRWAAQKAAAKKPKP